MRDKFGIAFAMMSNPCVSVSAYAGTQKGNDAAQHSNEFVAKLVSQYSRRIGPPHGRRQIGYFTAQGVGFQPEPSACRLKCALIKYGCVR